MKPKIASYHIANCEGGGAHRCYAEMCAFEAREILVGGRPETMVHQAQKSYDGALGYVSVPHWQSES